MIKLEFSFRKLFVHSQNGQPHSFPLPFHILNVRSHQALFKNLISQNLIKVFTETKQIPQPRISINIPYHDAENLSCVIKSELLKTVASLQQRASDHLALRKHAGGNLLIALKLRQKNMHFRLLHLIDIAKVYEKFIGLVKWNSHVAEVLDVFRQLVEDQSLVLGRLFVELLFLRLH